MRLVSGVLAESWKCVMADGGARVDASIWVTDDFKICGLTRYSGCNALPRSHRINMIVL